MMQVKWCWDYEVRDLGCYPTRPPYAGHAEPVHIIPLAALMEVVEGLRVIGMETYCDGPGCGWCEDGNRHPFTENAKEAQRLLTQLEAHGKEGA